MKRSVHGRGLIIGEPHRKSVVGFVDENFDLFAVGKSARYDTNAPLLNVKAFVTTLDQVLGDGLSRRQQLDAWDDAEGEDEVLSSALYMRYRDVLDPVIAPNDQRFTPQEATFAYGDQKSFDRLIRTVFRYHGAEGTITISFGTPEDGPATEIHHGDANQKALLADIYALVKTIKPSGWYVDGRLETRRRHEFQIVPLQYQRRITLPTKYRDSSARERCALLRELRDILSGIGLSEKTLPSLHSPGTKKQ